MSETRPPRKSETLEVRMSRATKRAFIEACRSNGETASEAVRSFAEGYLRRAAARAGRRRARSRGMRGMPGMPGMDGMRELAAFALSALRRRIPAAAPGGGALALAAVLALLALAVTSIAASYGRAVFQAPAPDAQPAANETVAWRDPRADDLAREFMSFDADGDGRVDHAEFEARRRCLLYSTFRRLDADSDGALSKNEFAEWPEYAGGDCMHEAGGHLAGRSGGVLAAP